MSDGWVKVGEIGIDSGLCWIGDPCYVIHGGSRKFKELGVSWKEFVANQFEKEKDNDKSVNGVAQYKYNHDAPGLGICAPTGGGDGTYNVYARYVGGKIAELKVVFFEK